MVNPNRSNNVKICARPKTNANQIDYRFLFGNATFKIQQLKYFKTLFYSLFTIWLDH